MKKGIKGRISDYPELFGISFDQAVEGPMQNSYLRLEKRSFNQQFHPVLKELEDAYRIINTIYRVKVTPQTEFPEPVTLIPTYPDLPMEDVYPRNRRQISGNYTSGRQEKDELLTSRVILTVHSGRSCHQIMAN